MAVFVRRADAHVRNPDAVEVDELKLISVVEQDVAVLVIAVSELLVLQDLDEVEPAVGQSRQTRRVAKAILDGDVQLVARDPRHDHDRPPLVVDANTVVDPLGRHDRRDAVRLDVLLQRPVPLASLVVRAEQTAHRNRPLCRLHVKRDGALAAGGRRNSERGQGELTGLEFRVGEGRARLLDRRGVLGAGRPSTRHAGGGPAHVHHLSFDVGGSLGGGPDSPLRSAGLGGGGCDG